MANEETLVLDGLALNDGITLGMLSLSCPPPRERQDWVGAADSEAQLLFRKPKHENRKVTARIGVVPQASMDLAHDKIAALVDKLAKASKYQNGITMTWTPATSARTVTFDVLAGEITDLPIDWESGWLALSPEIMIELTCKPYWRGTDCATVTDAFGSNSIADYTFDAGAAGNVTITGGVVDAVANLATENRFLHTASPYNVVSSQVTVKHTLGTTLTSYKAGVIAKRIDASNYIETYVDDTGAASRLRTDKVIATVRTNLVSTALTRLTVSTAYWVRVRLEGNVLVAEHWTSAPTVTGTPAATHTTTLAGGDATLFGSGVAGRAGIVWTPQQTAATLDDLEIAPNVAVSSAPFVTSEVASVPGDVPALGTVVVTDGAAQSRRHVEWGLEGPLTYNSATSLLIDSDDMVTSGFAGAQATTTGAYDPNASGNNSITATPIPSVTTAICGTGNLSHVGAFRVKARIKAGSTSNLFRLSWRAGDGPLATNDWVSADSTDWVELDLGSIPVPTVVSGTQRWTGQIEVTGAASSPGTAVVDYLLVVPVNDGYGVARTAYRYLPGVVQGYDYFIGTTAAAALNTRVAPLGGSWATSGDATDFVFGDTFTFTDTTECIARATSVAETTGRFAILGSTSYTDTNVEVSIYYNGSSSGDFEQAIVARWVDSSNYLRLVMPMAAGFVAGKPRLEQVVAGVATTLATGTAALPVSTIYRLALVAYASGGVIGIVMTADRRILQLLTASTSSAATGGALQSGKPGIRDRSTSVVGPASRPYTSFSASVPAPEPVAIYTGKSMQVRYDDVIRDDSTGTYTGRPPSYRGSRCLLPVGTSRVIVKARRNDIETAVDDQVTDRTQIQVVYTPRGLVVPRS